MARIRQNLSSESLFHFVSQLDYLMDIIQNGFVARYCYENFPLLNLPVGIPMKCFCDIPLGQIKVHISNYKGYGIGITKKFAMQKKITPVIYVHEKSATLLNYLKVIKSNSDDNLEGILPYFKIYEEKKSSTNKFPKRYYDEREWRFIPDKPEYIDLRNLTKTEIDVSIKKSNLSLPPRYRFIVPIDEIVYLFVEKENDLLPLIQKINNLNLIKNPEKDLLISKIITSRQIRYDF